MGSGGGRGEVTSDINVTPMADVMLVLLIIFMVITPMLQKGVSVELARTRNPIDMKEADRDDAVLVAITRDGKFWLGKDRVNIEDLAAKVNDLLSTRLDKTVFLKSDLRAKYGDVVQVVDSIRNAGVDKVALLTERLDDQVRR
ncbi:MAG: biopolymer transporter ExbD [Acidobacteria bacterium]|jgi:biopolymer transport protein ExbD/biopolymer transport protein TolR|nr:MAG: biopolymer transporter ExbD [Acidobacteriota bacterium]